MTLIEKAHEKLLALRQLAPWDDAGEPGWVEKHDRIESEISGLDAEVLSDVQIKLELLCDRLEQASVDRGDLMIAKSARDDLERLKAKAA